MIYVFFYMYIFCFWYKENWHAEWTLVDKLNDSIHKIENILCWQVTSFGRFYFIFIFLLQKKRMIRKTMRELLL